VLETGENESEKSWLCTAKRLFRSGAPDYPVVHRTVSGAPGYLGRRGRSREVTDGVRLKITGLSGEPMSAGPTVGRGIRARHVAEPTVGGGTGLSGVHRTCPVRQRLPDLQRSATVGCAVYGNKSGTGQCPVCTGLSGAPDDRRQGWPSRFVLNGS
jgi:hypothetical protein